MAANLVIPDIRHPDYLRESTLWSEWRDTFQGGEDYLQRYLQKFSSRETNPDFNTRKLYTPIPTFAKAAILDIRNSIFQRLEDVSRANGSSKYNSAVAGEGAGVDREGSSMNSFMGIDVLTELLVMGRCGVFVDAPSKVPSSLAEEAKSPYLYYYRVEDILSWTLDEKANDGTFKAVLLLDHEVSHTKIYDGIELPSGRGKRYRLVWKGEDGVVRCKFFDKEKKVIQYPDSAVDGSLDLGISVVPFIMADVGESLLTDVGSYQKALLNLVSGDVNWALKSNVPFLTIQQELRTAGAHLKKTADDATTGAQPSQNQREETGGTGRYYDIGMDRPDYIAPPTAPLEASMKLQEKLEDDIRKLINLAVTNKSGSRTESAEAKKLSSQGLEAGLSYIGTVLQQVEQRIARYWAMYENTQNPTVATVAYPDRYILKTDQERLDEAKALLDLMDRVPGKTIKKTIAKAVVATLLVGKQDVETLTTIMGEIEKAGYTTSAIQDVLQAHKNGLMGDELASEALGIRKGEVEKAKKDRADRAVAILAAQTDPNAPGGVKKPPFGGSKPANGAPKNPASRGVPELDPDKDSGSKEKE